jgi:hypothetical protein
MLAIASKAVIGTQMLVSTPGRNGPKTLQVELLTSARRFS